MSTTSTVTTSTLDVPGARLHYEVRGSGPLLVLVGAPMGAGAFTAAAELLASDHTVVTTDPRGIDRSTVDRPDEDSFPQDRAADLARLIAHVDAGPATVLGSSGGAVSVLALAQDHPGAAAVVIAHEPPLYGVVDDTERLQRDQDQMIAVYESGDRVEAQRQFLRAADIEMPEDVFQMIFGQTPDAQALADERFQFLHMMRGTTRWQPDVDRLRDGPTQVLVGIGEASGGQFCDRASRALAAQLGIDATMFPGGHVGFVEDPPAFVARLREVLTPG